MIGKGGMSVHYSLQLTLLFSTLRSNGMHAVQLFPRKFRSDLYLVGNVIKLSKMRPTDTWRNNNVILTSKRCRFDVIMTLLLSRVSTGSGFGVFRVIFARILSQHKSNVHGAQADYRKTASTVHPQRTMVTDLQNILDNENYLSINEPATVTVLRAPLIVGALFLTNWYAEVWCCITIAWDLGSFLWYGFAVIQPKWSHTQQSVGELGECKSNFIPRS